MRGIGAVSVVLAGAGFLGAVGAFFSEAACGLGGQVATDRCNHDASIYGGLLSAVVLTGVGVPLIVIGNRKEPASPENSATMSPWVGRQSAGLSLRFDL